MFCQSCGKQLPDDAKFCEGCGAQTAGAAPAPQYQAPQPPIQLQYQAPQYGQPVYQPPQTQYQPPQYQQPQYQAPQQYPVQKPKKKRIFLKVLLGIVAALVILIVVLALIPSGPVKNVQMASAIDPATMAATAVQSTFTPQAPIIYVTFTTDKVPVGSKLDMEWIYTTQNYAITTASVSNTIEDQYIQSNLTKPANNDWPVGDYEVKIYLNSKYITSAKFKVK